MMHVDDELPFILFDEIELEQLDQVLTEISEEHEDEDVFEIFELLGYLTAWALFPEPSSIQPQWLGSFFDPQKITDTQRKVVNYLSEQGLQRARMAFYQGRGVELPFESWSDEEAIWIECWAVGFVVAYLEQVEARQFDDDTELMELTLPFLVLSNLFEEEEYLFVEMRNNDTLLTQFVDALPDLLLDLYCYLNAPEEKKPAAHKKKTGNKKSKKKKTH